MFFFVYRNLLRLNDQICMVMAWKNYCVKGSSTIPMLHFCFRYIRALLLREGNSVFCSLRILFIPMLKVLL